LLCTKSALVCITHGPGALDILEELNADTVRDIDIIAKDKNTLMCLTWKKQIRFIDFNEFIGKPVRQIAREYYIYRQKVGELLSNSIIHNVFAGVPELVFTVDGIIDPSRLLSVNEDETTEFPSHTYFEINSEDEEEMKYYSNSYFTYYSFGCENVKTYAKLYAKATTCHLSDVIRHFVVWSTNNLNLSILHYSTLASFGYEAAFLITGGEYEFIKEDSIVQFVKKGIRPGLSFANVKVATANCERLNCFDGNDNNRSHIIEIDINGAYPYCMLGNLAYGDYRWLDSSDVSSIDWKSKEEDGKYGYILEVDLLVPKYLHDSLNEFPPCFVKRKVSYNELSPAQKDILKTMDCVPIHLFEQERVVGDLYPKFQYIIDYRLLKYYLNKGIIVTKYHQGIRFLTRKYLAGAIKKFCILKQQAKRLEDNIISDVLKPIMVSIYGKFATDTSAYKNFKLCNNKEDCLKWSSMYSFSDITIISDDLTIFHMNSGKEYNKYNIINAFMILEQSKLFMHQQYDKIKTHFNGLTKLVCGETDSLRIQIFDPENKFYTKMEQLKASMDFSRLPPSHVLYSDFLKDALGVWKLTELNIYQHVSIKSKVFSYITICDLCSNTYTNTCSFCKHYKKGRLGFAGFPLALRAHVDHEYFLGVVGGVEKDKIIEQSRSHYRLNALDLRRYFINNTRSLAYGHYRCDNNSVEIENEERAHEAMEL